jgi:transcriptional regulator with XRE-family HTH domain
MTDQLTFKSLRQRGGFKIAKLAREAKVSTSSIYRVEEGERVTRELVQALLFVINQKLGTNYTADDLVGIDLID